jgi:predicted nucleotidyltransferase
MDDAVRRQADAVVEQVRAVLDADLIGVYLYGSAVAGGLRPDSDLDLFVVAARPTTAEEKGRLAAGISPISTRRSRPAGWRPVELTIVVEADVRSWRSPPRMDFQYGEWLRDDFDAGRVEPAEPLNGDLAVLVTMVLRDGQPLLGPPAADVLDPVPRADLDASMLDGVDGLLADLAPDTRNVLLTLARIWSTLDTGEILSKDAAADWVLARLPEEHRPVLARARDGYLGAAEDRWDDEGRIQALASHLVSQIRREPARP